MLSVQVQIQHYIQRLNQSRQSDIVALHQLLLSFVPDNKLSFHSGIDAKGKTVSNPTIGYGNYKHKFANGKIDDMFKLGISANSTGISIYCMGLKDKDFLKSNYADSIGKATITGYCIKFKKLSDLNIEVLEYLVKDFLTL